MMNLEQLMRRHFRLTQELATAYRTQPWPTAHIDRLADDLAATEREIVVSRPADPPATPSHVVDHLGIAP
jgi:hypothetical protein